MVTLKTLKTTWLKSSTEQSESLDIADKVPLEAGQEFEVHSWAIDNHGHLRVAFAQGFGRASKNTWLVYEPHVELVAADGEVLKPDNEDETAPVVNRVIPPDEPIPYDPERKSKKIKLECGKTIDLYGLIPGTKNFYFYEATHGGERLPHRIEQYEAIVRVAKPLQKARDQIGKPFIITSWFRPEPWNRKSGGASRSQHLHAGAVDFRVEGMTGKQIARAIAPWWSGGLGLYANIPRIVHVDARPNPARWGL